MKACSGVLFGMLSLLFLISQDMGEMGRRRFLHSAIDGCESWDQRNESNAVANSSRDVKSSAGFWFCGEGASCTHDSHNWEKDKKSPTRSLSPALPVADEEGEKKSRGVVD